MPATSPSRLRHHSPLTTHHSALRTPHSALLCLALVVITAPALAQGLRMENALPLAPAREGAPLYVTGELQWDRPDLLEGRLRFLLHTGSDVLTAVETDPIVVVAGSTRFRQLIPIPADVASYGLSELNVTFLAEGVEFELGEIAVSLPQPGSWQSVLLAVEPTSGAGLKEGERLRDALALDKAFAGPAGPADASDFGVQMARVLLPANDFPEQPLAFCAFDALLLAGEGFTRLSGRQLDAVATWTRAGGALCVAADQPLEEKQLNFLENLFRNSEIGPFVRDDAGRLLEPQGTQSGLLARRAGLGFAILACGPVAELDLESPVWREAHARFWRLREAFVGHRRDGRPIIAGMFQPTAPEPLPLGMAAPYPSYAPSSAVPQMWSVPTPSFGTSVVESLRPASIRLMPAWAILAILFGYVALVGPVDYLLLGRFRLRKWTWLTFPAVTLAVTWGVVATADAFMSANHHAAKVEIIDLDEAGAPVRRTRLDLHFRGTSEPLVHDMRRAWFASLARAHFRNPYQTPQWIVVNGRMQAAQQTVNRNDAPTGPFAGTLPSRYAAPQRIAKWTPQVNRSFEIAPEVDVPSIDWAKLEAANRTPISLPGGQMGIAVRINSHKGNEGSQGALRHVVTGSSYVVRQNQIVDMTGDASFFAAVTAAADEERTSLQFQRSPLGLGRLDDLPFLDAPHEAALVVWTRSPAGDITIYRKPIGAR